jgi:hypothetical protein
VDEYTPVTLVADFATLLASHASVRCPLPLPPPPTHRALPSLPTQCLAGVHAIACTDRALAHALAHRDRALLWPRCLNGAPNGYWAAPSLTAGRDSVCQGFVLLLEPFDERYPDVPDPTLQLACVDASIAIKPVLERFQTVVLTSGALFRMAITHPPPAPFPQDRHRTGTNGSHHAKCPALTEICLRGVTIVSIVLVCTRFHDSPRHNLARSKSSAAARGLRVERVGGALRPPAGTISVEENLYPKILRFEPVTSKSIPLTLERNGICPLIVSKGSDQSELTSSYSKRGDESVLRNYGNLLLQLAATVPDGIIVFFVSYISMEQMISFWNSDGFGGDGVGNGAKSTLAKLLEHKLVFIETPDMVESALALRNFRRACDSGRGAIFMSVARGKVAEGVNFEGHYGRAVSELCRQCFRRQRCRLRAD